MLKNVNDTTKNQKRISGKKKNEPANDGEENTQRKDEKKITQKKDI